MNEQTTLGGYRAIYATVGASVCMAVGVLVLNGTILNATASEPESDVIAAPVQEPAASERIVAALSLNAVADGAQSVSRSTVEPLAMPVRTEVAEATPVENARADAAQQFEQDAGLDDPDFAPGLDEPPLETFATAALDTGAASLLPLDTVQADPLAATPEPQTPVTRPQLTAAPAPVDVTPKPKKTKKKSTPACVRALRSLARRTIIYFDSSSAAVDNRGRAAAYLLASSLRDCPEAVVRVVGHSDPKGDPGANLSLSWRRANNVLNIVGEGGFDTDRLSAWSHLQEHENENCAHFDVVDRRVSFEVSTLPSAKTAQASE